MRVERLDGIGFEPLDTSSERFELCGEILAVGFELVACVEFRLVVGDRRFDIVEIAFEPFELDFEPGNRAVMFKYVIVVADINLVCGCFEFRDRLFLCCMLCL